MICAKCDKEAKNGKVVKGEFICDKCGAAAKREALENQVKERHQRIGQMIERAERMIHTAKYDLNDLAELMNAHGMAVDKEASDA